MANQFIGLVMLVTLNSPPDVQLRGKVSSVVAGQSLTLQDVTSPGNGHRIAEITIKATDIKDLVEAPKENLLHSGPIAAAPVSELSRSRPFEDPAILSVGRRPSSQNPVSGLPSIKVPPLNNGLETNTTPAAVLVNASQNVTLHDGGSLGPDVHDPELAVGSVEKKSKKTPRRKQKKAVQQGSNLANGGDAPPNATPTTQTNRGKGWRQTPLLEPTSSFQPFNTLKKSRKGGNAYDNGWATEDATDVQEMGDFDFEGNLSKFDKRTVFEGIRADDMTAEEDRLVGHNRLPKPGTAGGKNLHYTENVLDHLNGRDAWKSEAGESDVEHDTLSQRGSGSGRTSRRAESRLRRPIQRKEGSFNNSQSGRGRSVDKTSGGAHAKSAFYGLPTNKRCDVASALQMLNLENIMDAELGLSEDMMTENAGRGIAEVTLSILKNRAVPNPQNEAIQSSPPFVVVCVGNNKSGQRAIAAGRHLRNHGVQVVVCVLGLEREAELLESLRRQMKVFRGFGGKILSKPDLMDYMKGLEISVDLIIDGLLGLTISFEELRTGDQAATYELIEWANRSKSKVLAIDIPTGIDPSSGKVSIIDGQSLFMHPDVVAAMGAPKKGLLQTMSMGEGRDWKLFLVDIGIADQAWKKAGTRMRRGVEFEGAWVIEMGFKKGGEE